jgi:hypothetical protein
MTEQQVLGHKVFGVICVLANLLIVGFLLWYLPRCWRRKLITFASGYGSMDFSRDANPFGYWLTFCAYASIAALSTWGFLHIAYELFHGPG